MNIIQRHGDSFGRRPAMETVRRPDGGCGRHGQLQRIELCWRLPHHAAGQ